ncbi:MAG TPA: glycosyltransferase [Mycobacteriales bacterium]|nr:glycosyltransferase [Mycobacteriales bacterium]
MSVAVVVPVRDGAELLDAALAALMPEAAAHGAAVVVVDDASTDASADVAERHGVTVVRRQVAGGPYVARNAGWQAANADVVVFTDVRCRARTGWLGGLLAGLADPAVAICGGDVEALTGDSAAERYVHKWQPLQPDRGLTHEFLPFLPTCNLATRRSVLVAVDGFRPMRSGGDLDFCWRVQLAGLGSVVYAPGAGVEWVPRPGTRAVVRQWYRYGAAKPSLYRDYARHGYELEPPPPSLRIWVREARRFARALRRTPARDWDVEVVDRLCQLAWWRGYRREWRSLATGGGG